MVPARSSTGRRGPDMARQGKGAVPGAGSPGVLLRTMGAPMLTKAERGQQDAADRLEQELSDYREDKLHDALDDARTEAIEEARARLQGEPATQTEFEELCEELFADYSDRAREEVDELVEARRQELAE